METADGRACLLGRPVPAASLRRMGVYVLSKGYLGFVAAVLIPFLLLACVAAKDTDFSPTVLAHDGNIFGKLEPLDTKYYASDEPLKEGVRHFYAGDFGISQKYFQAAVEKTPRDAAAWVGLAASYDRLRRFDLADHAYANAIRLSGPTVQILNNQGYSHLLRGDLVGAREKFLAAHDLDPDNPLIRNNLVLLSSSAQMVERHRPAYN